MGRPRGQRFSRRLDMLIEPEMQEFLESLEGSTSEFIRNVIEDTEEFKTWKYRGGRERHRKKKSLELITKMFNSTPDWHILLKNPNGNQEELKKHVYEQIEVVAYARGIDMSVSNFNDFLHIYSTI